MDTRICKGKTAYNILPSYLRIAKSLWTMGYEVFYCNGYPHFPLIQFLLDHIEHNT